MSNSFAKHFAKKLQNKSNEITVKDVRDPATLETAWQGNTLISVNSIGKLNCTLYIKEILAIIKALMNDPKNYQLTKRALRCIHAHT